LNIKAIEDEGRSPFLIVTVDANAGNSGKTPDYTVLMYGHLDKQPYGSGWDTPPAEPVIREDGKLYGRGSSDDGFAFFTAILAIKACQATGCSHPKCVITIEGSEEGEIFDLEHYMSKYKSDLGTPNLVICLDAAAYTDTTMTLTSSLRGYYDFDLTASVLSNNIHSGMAGGVAPMPLPILTNLLQRVQDFKTQDMK